MKKERFDRKQLADRIRMELEKLDHEEKPTVEEVLKHWKFEHSFDAYPEVVEVAVRGIREFSYYDYGEHMYYVNIPHVTVDQLAAVDALGVEIMNGVLNIGEGAYVHWLMDEKQGSPEEKAIHSAFTADRYSDMTTFERKREELIQKRMEEMKEELEGEEEFRELRQRLDQVSEDGLIRLSENRAAFLTPGMVEAIGEADI